MKVENKFLNMWRSLKEQGDCQNIAKEAGVSRVTISIAISSGECSSNVFVAINDYFTEKRNRINASKEKTNAAA